MTVFADSSSLVKLYVAESGSAAVRRLAEPLVVSELARVEVPAALWRNYRTRTVSSADALVLTETFEDDWNDNRFQVIGVAGSLLDDAARLVAVHGLRAYDGVQLASAVRARAVEPSITQFSTFDDELTAAATAEGFSP